MSDDQELAGKVVLVTGAGRGIGRAIALAFAARGCRLVLAGRTQATLDTAAKEIHGLGGRAMPLTCDVTKKQEVEGLRNRIAAQFGPVQILVNNAGMAPAAAFLEMPDQLWEEVLRLNLTATYYCCRIFLPEMLAAKWGRVINIASIVAKVAYSHTSAYTTSKHAVLGLTRALALEMARAGVTVNAICPGYVETEMTLDNARLMAEKTGKKVEEALGLFAGSSPQKRLIAPEEVAELAVMLASKSADGITGQAINIDGGAVMV